MENIRRRANDRENTTSPESCNDQTCSAMSPDGTTSIRTCYCKQENNISQNRYCATVTKKSVIRNEACGSSGGSPRGAKNAIGDKMPDTHRSVEVQPSNTILSPETSTALENAEKIINNAKMQLMEVCAMSSLDSARRNRNAYLDDPPLDDEAEELLYIRDLVASKFHEAAFSRSEASGKTSANSEEPPRITVRRVDLSAPKFRMSQRRRADWSSLGYDDRPRGRAPPAEGAPSKDSLENENVNEATVRDDRARDRRRRGSPATSAEREFVHARENACRIQTGPSVHIVDRELTRRDLEDVHISPEPSWAQSRANTATYTLRHGVAEGTVKNVANEPETSRAPKTLRVRLEHERPIVAEIAAEAVTVDASSKSEKGAEDAAEVRNFDSGRDNWQIESPKSEIRDYVYQEEMKNRDLQSARASEGAERVTNRDAMDSGAIENSSEITSGANIDGRYAEDRGIFDERSGASKRTRLRNEGSVGGTREESRNDRSKSPLAACKGDATRRASFPRRENTVSGCRATASSRSRRVIDEHLSSAFDNYVDERLDAPSPRDVADDKIRRRRSFVPSCSDDSRAEDDLDEIELYRPRLDDLDSILLSNDRKIERVVRATETFAEFLSRPEFARYQPDEGERTPRHASHGQFHGDSPTDKDHKRSFVPDDPSVTCASAPRRARADASPRATSANTAGSKSLSFTKKYDYPGNYTRNSAESSVYPASEASAGSRMSKDVSDDKQQKTTKVHLSESSLDRSDATTFSNMAPALSSTRTDTQAQDNRHADAKSRATSMNKPSEIDYPQKGHSGSVFGRIARSLKDTSDAADRFVACLLQDEKRSIERKVTSALRESAITPAAVRRLLDYLREAEETRDARQTETLDILKNILITVKNQTDQGVSHENVNDDTIVASQDAPDSSIQVNAPPDAIESSILREENARRAEINAAEIGRVAENSHDPKDIDKHPSDLFEPREARRSVRLASHWAQSSRNDSKRNLKGNPCSESSNQISDIRSDDGDPGKGLESLSARIASVKFDDGRKMETDDAAIAPSGNNEDFTSKQKREDESGDEDPAPDDRRADKSITTVENKDSVVAVKAIQTEETQDNIASADKKFAFLEASEMKEERARSEAKIVDQASTKKDSPQYLVVEERISPADSRSADSQRDCASLWSLKTGNVPLKDVASLNKQISFTVEKNNSTCTRDGEIRGKSMMIAANENLRDENKDLELLNGAKSDNEQQPIDRTNTLQTYRMNILSSSNSSVNSTRLDHVNRYSNGVSGANAKKLQIETSSETSHSEGELYMPSSCSYSLGEVRVLKKRDLIMDSTTDRDSSTTVLITKSMLTSLNDSTASLVEDFGHI